MKTSNLFTCMIAMLGVLGSTSVLAASASDKILARGRYLVATTGCNDCHTPHYPESGGKIPQKQWLVGSPVGFQGPWGTTYPANLRLIMHKMTEKQWMAVARKPLRPPMPWFSLREMTNADLRAIYAFIHSLGPAGKPAPNYAPPGVAVNTPYIEFVPKNLPQTARAGH
jgi:mono/diheme cytochrome c family protein